MKISHPGPKPLHVAKIATKKEHKVSGGGKIAC